LVQERKQHLAHTFQAVGLVILHDEIVIRLEWQVDEAFHQHVSDSLTHEHGSSGFRE